MMACFAMVRMVVVSSSLMSLVVTATSPRQSGLAWCADDESYRSSLGLSCFQHRHLDCGALPLVGLIGRQELASLMASCPVSCNAPPCSDEHKRLVSTGGDNDALKRTIATSRQDREYKTSEFLPEARTVRRREQSSCYPNWPTTCQDDPSYTNKIGLDCSKMIVFTCDEMHKLGFSDQETHDLITSCPCSCGIMCG